MQVVFDRKRGCIGIKRLTRKKEREVDKITCNYAVDVLSPVTLEPDYVVSLLSPNYDWIPLPDSDDRVRFLKLFQAIDDADWYFNVITGNDRVEGEVEERYIENPHEVFQKIRKIFLGK